MVIVKKRGNVVTNIPPTQNISLRQFRKRFTPEVASKYVRALDGVRIGDILTTETDGVFAFTRPAGPDIETVRARKLAEISNALEQAKTNSGTSGLISSALGSPHRYYFDRDDLQYAQRVISAGEGIDGVDSNGNPRGIICKDVSDAWVMKPHNAAQLAQIESEYFEAIKVIFARFNLAKFAARTATTIEEIEAIHP